MPSLHCYAHDLGHGCFEKVHKNFVVDSLFFTGGSGFRKKCGGDLNQIVEALGAKNSTVHLITDPGTAETLSASGRKQIDAVLCGDEVDGTLDADHLRSTLACSVQSMKTVPELPTYIGSKTSRNVQEFMSK